VSENTDHAAAHPPTGYGLYVKVWAALVVLTGVTVGVSYVQLGHVTMLTALLIATAKTSLVLLYFMHLRYEGRLYFYMIMVVLITYLVFLGLTFTDYGFD
jgi:cytochrome c oxidase subunit 4